MSLVQRQEKNLLHLQLHRPRPLMHFHSHPCWRLCRKLTATIHSMNVLNLFWRSTLVPSLMRRASLLAILHCQHFFKDTCIRHELISGFRNERVVPISRVQARRILSELGSGNDTDNPTTNLIARKLKTQAVSADPNGTLDFMFENLTACHSRILSALPFYVTINLTSLVALLSLFPHNVTQYK